MPVSMHAMNEGDYSTDDHFFSFKKIGLDLIIDVLLDQDPQAQNIDSRATALAVSLMTPVPSVTPGMGNEINSENEKPIGTSTDYPDSTLLPGGTSTSTLISLPSIEPTLVTTSQPVNTSTPSPFYLPPPSATPIPTKAPRNYSAPTTAPTSTLGSHSTNTPTGTSFTTGMPPGTGTLTVTATGINTNTASPTVTGLPSSNPTTTVTPTGPGLPATSPTISPNPTDAVTPSITQTNSPPIGTIPASNTPTPTASYTATPAPIWTETATATSIASQVPAATFTETNIPIYTQTSTLTPTNSSTDPVTGTPAPVGTPSETPSVTFTLTSTATYTPISTITNTPTNTSTLIPTSTIAATNTPLPTLPDTPTSTETNTPTNTSTPSLADTSTYTPTSTEQSTQTPTPTVGTTSTATNTPTIVPTPTPDLPECFVGRPPGVIPSDDAYIRASSPSSNFGSMPDIEVRPDNGANRRGLVRFDLSSIPSGSTVTSASLYLYEIDKKLDQITYLYRVTSMWSESSVSWDFPWTNLGGDFDNSVAYATFLPNQSNCMLTIDLTTLVQEWVNGTPNYGILLYSTGPNHILRYASKENSSTDQHPKLDITYIEPTFSSSNSNLYQIGPISGSSSHLVK